MKDRTKLILVILIAAIVILVTYKIYAPYPIQNFNAVNLKNIKRIKSNLPGDSFSFVVLGNIKNSISIFDKNILKELQTNRPEFIISTGNNVVDSGHGKYRVLNRTLQDMKIPFITSVGENEIRDEGHKNFYKYFGPFYFSFAVEDAYFIFLDSTGHSSDMWQNEWLSKELKAAQNYQHRFVVMNKPPLEPDETLPEDIKDNILSRKKRNYYRQIFSRYDVTAVFSSGLPLYHRQEINGVNYIISGGAGGELLIDNPQSFHHYVQVQINPDSVNYTVKELESNPGFFVKLTVNFWVGLQSFLYTNYLNIIIIALIVFMAGFLFYRELNRKV
ncbi:MAG: metallophosphoesterase family protein, partial [Halanaerobiaceae bacterium]